MDVSGEITIESGMPAEPEEAETREEAVVEAAEADPEAQEEDEQAPDETPDGAEGGEADAEGSDGSEGSEEGDDSRYAFPEAAIVRIMKRYLDKEKMIKKDVKVAMNKWLEEMCAKVTTQMNKVPYVMMTITEFNEGKRIFDDLSSFDKEKKRILAHLDFIKKDIERLERDLGKVEKDIFEVR
jgi:hypothetical protein